MEFTARIQIPNKWIGPVFGAFDSHIKKIESALQVSIVNRGEDVVISSDNVKNIEKAKEIIDGQVAILENGTEMDEQQINYLLSTIDKDEFRDVKKLGKDVVSMTISGKPIKAKTVGQQEYIDAIRQNTIIFGVGPAGTGKTYLAMAMAIEAFKRDEVKKIILTRPAIEAGENLGFLPGDLQEKVDPYLRPLYDALYDIMGVDQFMKNLETGRIEIAPLAYMRGRTLDDAFIVLDEAQNTTPEQMKMFLTRLGFGSKAVVTGDVTQIDLPSRKQSGLTDALRILNDVEGIKEVKLTEKDVVRHPLIQQIILSYDKDQERKEREQFEREEKRRKEREELADRSE